MKNLIKPLEWNISVVIHETRLSDFVGCYYQIRQYKDNCCALLYDKTDGTVYEIGEYATVEEAKAACKTNCAENVFDLLSAEARAILEQHLNK